MTCGNLMQPDFASADAVVQDVDQAPAAVVPPPMIRPGNTFCGMMGKEHEQITFLDLFKLLNHERTAVLAQAIMYQLLYGSALDQLPSNLQREVVNFSAVNQYREKQPEFLQMFTTVVTLDVIKNVITKLCEHASFDLRVMKKGKETIRRSAFHSLMLHLNLIEDDATFLIVDQKQRVIDFYKRTNDNGEVIFKSEMYRGFLDCFLLFADLCTMITRIPHCILNWSDNGVLIMDVHQCSADSKGTLASSRKITHRMPSHTVLKELSLFHRDGQMVVDENLRFGSDRMCEIFTAFIQPTFLASTKQVTVCMQRMLAMMNPVTEIRKYACEWQEDHGRFHAAANHAFVLIPQHTLHEAMKLLKNNNAYKNAPKHLLGYKLMVTMPYNHYRNDVKEACGYFRNREYANFCIMSSSEQVASQMLEPVHRMDMLVREIKMTVEDTNSKMQDMVKKKLKTSGVEMKAVEKRLMDHIESTNDQLLFSVNNINRVVTSETACVKDSVSTVMTRVSKMEDSINSMAALIHKQNDVLQNFVLTEALKHRILVNKVDALKAGGSGVDKKLDVTDVPMNGAKDVTAEKSVASVLKKEADDTMKNTDVGLKNPVAALEINTPVPVIPVTSVQDTSTETVPSSDDPSVDVAGGRKPLKLQHKSNTRTGSKRKRDDVVDPQVAADVSN